MFGLSLLLLLLAIVAGIFGFFGLAGTLTTLAVIAFYVFVALLVISLIAQAFGEAGGRGGAVGGLIAVVLVVGGIYWWTHNHPGALNRASADASSVFHQTDDKAKQVVGDVAHDARKAIDERKADRNGGAR